jgi:hypothetical protein
MAYVTFLSPTAVPFAILSLTAKFAVNILLSQIRLPVSTVVEMVQERGRVKQLRIVPLRGRGQMFNARRLATLFPDACHPHVVWSKRRHFRLIVWEPVTCELK